MSPAWHECRHGATFGRPAAQVGGMPSMRTGCVPTPPPTTGLQQHPPTNPRTPRPTLLGIMPGMSMGSFHSISHMGPSSGGSRLRSSLRSCAVRGRARRREEGSRGGVGQVGLWRTMQRAGPCALRTQQRAPFHPTSSSVALQATGGPPCTCSGAGVGRRVSTGSSGSTAQTAAAALQLPAQTRTPVCPFALAASSLPPNQPHTVLRRAACELSARAGAFTHHQHLAPHHEAQGQPAEGLAEHLRHLRRVLVLHLAHKPCGTWYRGWVSGWVVRHVRCVCVWEAAGTAELGRPCPADCCCVASSASALGGARAG